ncbi:hypothetical protein AK812_SmicGene45840, partial [Symbiodinium microadriaticum]
MISANSANSTQQPGPVIQGLNAALRREHTRAGHARSALSVFRAADTVAALRAIARSLQ